MLRRSPNSATPLHQKREELSRLESELQSEVARLERIIAEAPRVAEETSRRQREELLRRANEGGSRLDASVALRDKRYGDEDHSARRGRHRSLRKARREGRIVFLVLVIALAAAVIWLASHLRF